MGLVSQEIEIDLSHSRKKILKVVTSALDHSLFAFAHGVQIDRNRACVDPVFSGTLREISNACAGDHRFGGRTAKVHTNTTDGAALNHRHFPACFCKFDREKSAALAGTDHNHIVFCGLWHPDVILLLLHTSYWHRIYNSIARVRYRDRLIL